MVGDLPTNVQGALMETSETIAMAYGLETWDKIHNDLHDPESV
jgi:hypothetical protein